MANKVKDLVAEKDPDIILIEEVNRGVNRIGQKSLDALHFFVLDRFLLINENALKKCKYIDSNGKKGWRTALGLKLDDQDKEYNKQARDYNKDHKAAIKRGDKVEREVIGWKHLSIRYANKKLKLDLNPDTSGDADIADAICLGLAYIKE